jgi:hypothetical protein
MDVAIQQHVAPSLLAHIVKAARRRESVPS